MDIGSAVGRVKGVTAEQFAALDDYRTHAAFSEEERLAIALAEAMTRQPVEVSDALWSSLAARFSERQRVELVAAIAWENFRARMNHAIGLPSEGLAADGAACALP